MTSFVCFAPGKVSIKVTDMVDTWLLFLAFFKTSNFDQRINLSFMISSVTPSSSTSRVKKPLILASCQMQWVLLHLYLSPVHLHPWGSPTTYFAQICLLHLCHLLQVNGLEGLQRKSLIKTFLEIYHCMIPLNQLQQLLLRGLERFSKFPM